MLLLLNLMVIREHMGGYIDVTLAAMQLSNTVASSQYSKHEYIYVMLHVLALISRIRKSYCELDWEN